MFRLNLFADMHKTAVMNHIKSKIKHKKNITMDSFSQHVKILRVQWD